MSSYSSTCPNRSPLTRNEEGIYLRAKKDIKSDENIFIEIKIKDNDGSDYSKVRMNITTFIPNPGSSDNPAVSPAKDDKEKIKVLHKAYIDGYPDKSFGGDKNVTREQIAKMVSVTLDINLPKKGNLIKESFSDVKKSRWSIQYIERTKELRLIRPRTWSPSPTSSRPWTPCAWPRPSTAGCRPPGEAWN